MAPRTQSGPRKYAVQRSVACKASVEFAKYQGLGNDFILVGPRPAALHAIFFYAHEISNTQFVIQVDNRHQAEPVVTSEQAVKLCDRHFGIGGDGVIFALPSDKEDFTMRIFNSDGSEPEMCGNGIRCLARFIADEDGEGSRTYRVATGAGLIQPQLLADGLVRVDMGEPRIVADDVPTTLESNAEV